jgi:capsular polysaccharide biosynthesis protein
LTDFCAGKNFGWRLLRFGSWRLVWSSFLRRPARMIAAAAAGRIFRPLPPEPAYPRQRPRIERARPDFMRGLDHLCATPAQPPSGGMAEFEEICAVAGGVLLTRNGDVVAESLANSEDVRLFSPFLRLDGALTARFWPLTPIKFLPGDYIYLQQFWDGNYGHWLVELLPRIAIAAQFCDLSQCRIVVTRKSGGMSRVYRDSLGLFGVKPEQIVTLKRRPVMFERLHYPLPVSQHPWIKSPRAIALLETLPDKVGAPGDGPKRLYVTRNSGKNRRLTNEAEIFALLRPLGFVAVEPGKMSFADQVRIFSGAEMIVGNCGAALTNMVFSPRGVSVMALTTPFMQDDFFWDLTDLKQGRFFSLHGEADDAERGPKSDFSIDLAALKAMLDEFMAETVR